MRNKAKGIVIRKRMRRTGAVDGRMISEVSEGSVMEGAAIDWITEVSQGCQGGYRGRIVARRT